MPHSVSFIQDDKDPSVMHPMLINLGPLGMKEEAPPTELESGHFVMVKDLASRRDLNHRAGRVLSKSWTEAARRPGRVPVEMVVGKESIWVKIGNLAGPILDVAAMTAPPYTDMSPEERTEVGLILTENTALGEALARGAPALSASARAPRPNEPVNLFQDMHESVEAPAAAPAPAPPAADRRDAARAALQRMAAEHCPRPHYCIYCGSEGPVATKCMPCGFYRGTFCFPPKGGDTFMGRKLTYVKWPWTGDLDAPYVRAGVAADAAPKSKYAVDPPPVRAMTRDEVLGPNPCAGVCPKYPSCTAARLVAYVLGKVDHVTPGVKSDFRYFLVDTEDWRKTRERIIEIHEAGEENAAEVLHEEYLVQHHTLCQTAPGYLPADWDGMKRRVKARQKKDKGAEERVALEYPDSDADEEDVNAYLEAKMRQLDADAAPAPAPAPAPTNPKPERKGDPWGVAAFFEQLLKELPFYHREEMAEIRKCETIKDFEVGEVIDGRNRYEKSLTVSLTKTPCEDSDDEDSDDEDSDDEDSDDEDSDHASVPAESTTKTITLKTYMTPYDDNNAGVWLVDETGYEHELASVGTIPCPGGEPVRSFNKASAERCARYVVAYLVYGWRYWRGD